MGPQTARATAEGDATFAHHGFESFREALDGGVDSGVLTGLDDLQFGRVRQSIGHGVEHGPIFRHRLEFLA